MKRYLCVSAIAALCACAAPVFSEEPLTTQPLTIEKALETAFQMSPTIRAVMDQLEKSKGGVREAAAGFMPKFNAQLQQIQQGPAVSFFEPTIGQIDIVRNQDTVGNAGVFLPIDASKQLAYTGDIAKYKFQIDYLALLGASQQLIFDVKHQYYTLLRAIGQQGTAQSAVDVAMQRLKDSRAKFEAGTVPKFDVTRAEVEVKNLNQELIVVKSLVEQARAALNRTMGIDVTLPTQVVDVDVKIDVEQVDAKKYIDLAYARRPEIMGQETAIALNERNVKLQRTGILPTVGLNGAYNYDFRVAGFTTQNASWIATVTVGIPIWDGGVTKAKVDQAWAEVERSREVLDQLKLSASFEVKKAALNLAEAAERTKTTAEAVELAEETLRLATVRYDAGIATLVEVTDSESALTNAKFFQVQAKYDYAVATADLQRASSTQPEVKNLQLLDTRLGYKSKEAAAQPAPRPGG